MIVITAITDFIGSCLTQHLQTQGYHNLVGVGDVHTPHTPAQQSVQWMERFGWSEWIPWLRAHARQVEFVFAITPSGFADAPATHPRESLALCAAEHIPVIYISTESDLNPWAQTPDSKPYFWAGLQCAHAYGQGEAQCANPSVLTQALEQIRHTGRVCLHPSQQGSAAPKRDFVYVADVVSVCDKLMHTRKHSGLYYLGNGQAYTLLALVDMLFVAVGQTPQIDFVDTPEAIGHPHHLPHTHKDKLMTLDGFVWHSLEAGITDYVQALRLE